MNVLQYPVYMAAPVGIYLVTSFVSVHQSGPENTVKMVCTIHLYYFKILSQQCYERIHEILPISFQ